MNHKSYSKYETIHVNLSSTINIDAAIKHLENCKSKLKEEKIKKLLDKARALGWKEETKVIYKDKNCYDYGDDF